MSRDSKKRGRLVDKVKLTKKIDKDNKENKSDKGESVTDDTSQKKLSFGFSRTSAAVALQQCNTAADVGSIVMNACKPFAIFRRGVKTLLNTTGWWWGELLKMLHGSMKNRCYLCMCSTA